MMRRVWLSAAAVLFIAAPLSAGVAQPARVAFPEPRFTSQPPFQLAVGAIEIVNRDPPTLAPPRVEHLVPLAPARAIRDWVRDRLVATGGPNRLRVTIQRAHITETALTQNDSSLAAAATDQQSQRYDAIAEVRLDILDPSGHAVATVRGIATRFQTVLRSTSPAQRDGMMYDLTMQLIEQLTPTLSREIRSHFTAYLR